ncbi:MAG: hypothetical protein GXO10_04320 [Crenarchaeota archaeon]|nr:hypothetical protein [Thermoproteota archaeon]
MAPAETDCARLVKEVVSALLQHCEKFCSNRKARTVIVRTGHLAATLDVNGSRPSYTLIGQILRDIMYYLKSEGAEITVRGASSRKKYVL